MPPGLLIKPRSKSTNALIKNRGVFICPKITPGMPQGKFRTFCPKGEKYTRGLPDGRGKRGKRKRVTRWKKDLGGPPEKDRGGGKS